MGSRARIVGESLVAMLAVTDAQLQQVIALGTANRAH